MRNFIQFLCPLFVLSLLLSSCIETSVIDDDQREVPDNAEAFEEREDPAEEANQPPTITPDMTQSFIAFRGSKGETTHEGTFTGFDFKIVLDEEDPLDITKASLGLLLNINSLVTDSDGLTEHLLNEDFFEAETYPNATFFSTSIDRVEGDGYAIVGNLTMKGIEKEIAFPAEITDSYLLTEPVIDRTEFGIGSADDGIDVSVPMEIQMVFADNE